MSGATGVTPSPAALANGEELNAAVGAQGTSGGVHELPRPRLDLALEELAIVAARDEADFLGVALVRQVQPSLARQAADLRLGEAAHRQQDSAKLRLSQPETARTDWSFDTSTPRMRRNPLSERPRSSMRA